MNNKNVKPALVPALDKGLEVLELLAQSDAPHSLSQIAKKLNRSVSELQRTIQCLLDRGYLSRDLSSGFQLSAKLFSLAHYHPPHQGLLTCALPFLDWFTKETHQSIHISVPQGLDLVIIGQVESKTRARITIQNGLTLDHTTISGKIFFAHLPPLQQKIMLEKRVTSPLEQQELKQDVFKIKKNGYLLGSSAYYEGLTDLAVPLLFPHSGELCAVLATNWINPRDKKIHEMFIIEKMKSTAAQVLEFWSVTST